ncbi:MAG: hypothetical protein FWG66_08565 [Spirochaetes bacterium]|nr:hypothetical protein [Spirochaetota bacterium]
MVKKLFLLFFAAALPAAGAFAQTGAQLPLSFGVSASISGDLGGGVSGRITEPPDGIPAVADRLGEATYSHGPYSGRGSSIFLDARFVQFSVGYFQGTSSERMTGPASPATSRRGPSLTWLEIGLLGKFPVELSDRVTVFPLGGLAYRLMLTNSVPLNPLSESLIDPFNPLHASALWFRIGGGMDFNLSQAVFLRRSFTYGLRLRSRWENNMVNDSPHDYFTPGSDLQWGITYDNASLGHGFDVTVGVGFRLR